MGNGQNATVENGYLVPFSSHFHPIFFNRIPPQPSTAHIPCATPAISLSPPPHIFLHFPPFPCIPPQFPPPSCLLWFFFAFLCVCWGLGGHATRTRDPRRGGSQGVDGRYNVRRSGAPGPHAQRNAVRQVVDDRRAEVRGQQKPSNDPHNNQHQYANYWAPRTHKRHPPHPAQPRHTSDWAPRTRKRHQQEHRPQRPTERSDQTQHAKGRTGDCPGPRKETGTRRNVTQGGGGGGIRGTWCL